MSQLRQHLKYGWPQAWRRFFHSQRGLRLGAKVWIDKRVEFMRYPAQIELGSEVVIKEGTRICACNAQARISIGERSTIGYHNFIFASEQISIGHDCLIAPFVYLVDSDHRMARSEKINGQGNESAPISIGNDVWIASNVTVLKGTIIEDGAVIAANSVVKGRVGAYEIWAGSPAKKVGDRS